MITPEQLAEALDIDGLCVQIGDDLHNGITSSDGYGGVSSRGRGILARNLKALALRIKTEILEEIRDQQVH